jgi:RNA recognition motif-containing protein
VRKADVITDRDRGQSKGFGFVEMEADEAAQAAINSLNGQDHGGRSLQVNEARPPMSDPAAVGAGVMEVRVGEADAVGKHRMTVH